jgi:hypothetical protein
LEHAGFEYAAPCGVVPVNGCGSRSMEATSTRAAEHFKKWAKTAWHCRHGIVGGQTGWPNAAREARDSTWHASTASG